MDCKYLVSPYDIVILRWYSVILRTIFPKSKMNVTVSQCALSHCIYCIVLNCIVLCCIALICIKNKLVTPVVQHFSSKYLRCQIKYFIRDGNYETNIVLFCNHKNSERFRKYKVNFWCLSLPLPHYNGDVLLI